MPLAPPPAIRGVTPTADPGNRSPLAFFALVFALSIPFWLLGAATGRQLTPDLPVSAFIWVSPVIAASILVYRVNGAAGVTALLRRSFDYARIRDKRWYIPTLLLLPGIYAATYLVMRAMGLPLPSAQFPVLPALVWFLGASSPLSARSWAGRVTRSLRSRSAGPHWGPASCSVRSGSGFISCHWCRATAPRSGSPGGRWPRWR